MHKHYPVLFTHSFSCVNWYISWVNDASVETQTEKSLCVFLLCYLPPVCIRNKRTDLKSNQFSGVKLQNVITQLISPGRCSSLRKTVFHLVPNFHRETKQTTLNIVRIYCLIIIKLTITVKFKCTITSLQHQLGLLQHKPCISNRHATRNSSWSRKPWAFPQGCAKSASPGGCLGHHRASKTAFETSD